MVFVVWKSTAALGMLLTLLTAPSENQAPVSKQGFTRPVLYKVIEVVTFPREHNERGVLV